MRQERAKMVEPCSMPKRSILTRPTKIPDKHKKCVLLPSLQDELAKEVPLLKKEPQIGKRLNPWSKDGLVALYEAGLHVGKGQSLPPHVVPYRFLGTPDLKRDDSLLPKAFQFAQRMKFQHTDDLVNTVQRVEGEPMVLPLTLKEACWNGERWQGTSQTASEAKRSNGFNALYSEVVKSQKRVILCKTGQYFLAEEYAPNDDDHDHDDEEEGASKSRRSSLISEIPQRQHKRRPSMARPFIPPLHLKKLRPFEEAEALGHNEEILSTYREESQRYETARLVPESERTSQDKKVLLSGRTVSGLPLRACGKISLRQLGNILKTSMDFHSMQNKFNVKLIQNLRSIQTTRPYHFAREFGMQHRGDWDPSKTPRRAETFRKHLLTYKWYEELFDMVYNLSRRPTKSEVFIVEDIRRVLDEGGTYSKQSFTNTFLTLRQRDMDLENIYVQKALIHVQNAIKVSDLELLTDLMFNRAKIPSWLESKTAIVKQAMRELSPNLFPMNKWADGENRKTTPVTKLRKLYWMKDKFAALRQRRESKEAQEESFHNINMRSRESISSLKGRNTARF